MPHLNAFHLSQHALTPFFTEQIYTPWLPCLHHQKEPTQNESGPFFTTPLAGIRFGVTPMAPKKALRASWKAETTKSRPSFCSSPAAPQGSRLALARGSLAARGSRLVTGMCVLPVVLRLANRGEPKPKVLEMRDRERERERKREIDTHSSIY